MIEKDVNEIMDLITDYGKAVATNYYGDADKLEKEIRERLMSFVVKKEKVL